MKGKKVVCRFGCPLLSMKREEPWPTLLSTSSIRQTKKVKNKKKSKIYSFKTKNFSPKNFFLWAQCEIYYTSPPNAPPSNATSKQTELILHLQVFQLHNSSEKQTVFTIHVQRLEVYSRWPDLGPAPPTIVVYLK